MLVAGKRLQKFKTVKMVKYIVKMPLKTMKTTKYGSIILAEYKEKNITELLFNCPNLICIQIKVKYAIQNFWC